MQKFLVLYLVPAAGLKEWMKIDPETRKAEEKKMEEQWNEWTKAHGAALLQTAGAGRTKRVTAEGIAEVKNDVMLFSIAQAESAEAAAELFKDHPHLGIPDASIEIMPANALPEA